MIVTAEEALVPNAELFESFAFADALALRLRSSDASSSSGSVSSHSHEALQSLALSAAQLAGTQPLLTPDAPSSDASSHAQHAQHAQHAVRPGSQLKPWLRISSTGVPSTFLASAHTVAQRYAVPLRDLRVLDSGLTTSFSAALLCRKRTIVVNLEHVKLLLTCSEMLLPPGASAECASFIAEVCRRLQGSSRAAVSSAHADPLPFEFVVLDAALEAVTSALEHATLELERDTPHALDALGAAIDASTLGRVRRLKGFISRDVARAAAVRGEVLRFLDDDSDMRGMYLTRKAAERRAMAAQGSGGHSGGGSGGYSGFVSPHAARFGYSMATTPGAGLRSPSRQWSTLVHGTHAPGQAPVRSLSGRMSGRASGGMTPTRRDRGQHTPHASAIPERRDSGGSATLEGAASLALALERLDEDADVQELEDILETYFAQLDRTCARLNALEEHVSQTEDYVNIDLDSKRNVLIEVMLVTAFIMTAALWYTSFTGAFAMMLPNFTDQGAPAVMPQFYWLNGVCSVAVVTVSVCFVWVMKRRRILHF